jgi:hypothetical protein
LPHDGGVTRAAWDGQSKQWRGRDLAALWSATVFVRVAARPPATFTFANVPMRVTPTYEVIDPRGTVVGRVWYFREPAGWHLFDPHGQDRRALPRDRSLFVHFIPAAVTT